MISISLCMIVKNEEKVLGRCLSSVQDLVDEIIIVDTGSTDNTKQIAREFTDLIYDFEWIDDFSAARNFSFSKATKEYQMWLDADDILEEEDRKRFKELKSELKNDIDIVFIQYNCLFDEEDNPIFSLERERILKREKNYKWVDSVHEYIKLHEVNKTFRCRDIFITHRKEVASTDRNMKIYESQLKKGITFSVHGNYQFGLELLIRGRFPEAIFYFNRYLDSTVKNGNNIASAYFFLSEAYKNLGKEDEALEVLLECFKCKSPEAEICYKIGLHFKERKEYEIAISWFNFTRTLKRPSHSRGTMLHDYWGYAPNIELVSCYLNLNNIEKAIYHQKLAKECRPDSAYIHHMESSLNSILSRIEKINSHFSNTTDTDQKPL